MKKLYDLFDFDEIEIKPTGYASNIVYTATLKKLMNFQIFDEREDRPTKEQWIEKSKDHFIMQILDDDFLKKCDEDNIEYFTDLKNAIEKSGLVDQFLWDRGLKKRGSTWTPTKANKKNNMQATITFDLNEPEDRAKHKLITHIDEITLTLWELDDHLRKVIKYDQEKSDDYLQAFCDLREVLRELLLEKGLTIDLMN